jgi:hypothetical protein
MTANELHCTACKRAGTWWELNTLACTHADGCALDAKRPTVLVCGSRAWLDVPSIRTRLRELPPDTVILHGGARGADQIAATIGRALGLIVREFRADWSRLGKRAGYVRNVEMLDERPDLVLAFQLDASKGTQHTIDEARKRGIPVEVVTSW